MAFQTQNSIKNDYCLEGGGPGRRSRRKAGPRLEQQPSGKTAAYALQSVGNKTKTQLRRREGEKKKKIPNVPSLHIDLYGPIRARCRFHPSADGRANSQQSPLHASPSLIVNSVNEVNLINFRAGSHMTFSSIFSPTSKTSISSSKMGRSE